MVVYYGDLDQIQITDEQYHNNIIHQYHNLDPIFSINELENLVDILQIPYDIRLAICQVITDLPELVKRLIFIHHMQ